MRIDSFLVSVFEMWLDHTLYWLIVDERSALELKARVSQEGHDVCGIIMLKAAGLYHICGLLCWWVFDISFGKKLDLLDYVYCLTCNYYKKKSYYCIFSHNDKHIIMISQNVLLHLLT